MRTAVDIPDATYRALKARAARQGRSVKALLLEAAEHAVGARASTSNRRVQLPLVPSKRPGRLRLDNERLYDAIALP